MDNNEKQPKEFSDVLDFIEETRDGKFTDKEFSISELLKSSISREEAKSIQNDNIQTSEIILSGLH